MKINTNYQKMKGTVDILPDQVETWQKIEDMARKTFNIYGYKEMRTPLFEAYDVFARNVGDTSDIVSKQMYDFEDKGGRRLALRPEGTAGIVRSYVENKLYGPEFPKPFKTYYMGPMFRYERPQSGRQRQFTQIGCEALNSESPQIDVEVISEALHFFQQLGLTNLKLVINTLGDKETRKKYKEALVDYLVPFYDQLSADSRERLYKNPLRVLDSKDVSDQKIVENAPSILDNLSEYSLDYFKKVRKLLKQLDIEYEIDASMVRGLDYYNQTIFEIMSNSAVFNTEVKGNSYKYVTVCGGGRYNGLISQLGGPDQGGIGYGIGVERLILLVNEENPNFETVSGPDLFFVSADQQGDDLAFTILDSIRKKGVISDKNFQDIKVGSQIKEANRVSAKYYTVLGKNEVENNRIKLVNIKNKTEAMLDIYAFEKEPMKYLK
ncbi:histidine--tRNA ligase [Dellaglioa sp. BT-FLS60]